MKKTLLIEQPNSSNCIWSWTIIRIDEGHKWLRPAWPSAVNVCRRKSIRREGIHLGSKIYVHTRYSISLELAEHVQKLELISIVLLVGSNCERYDNM